jgi:chromosome partitioning protein
MKVLTVANKKGGAAKTVTALELDLGLAKRGKRVVLVDLEGQATLTLALPPPTPAQPKKGGARLRLAGPEPSAQ